MDRLDTGLERCLHHDANRDANAGIIGIAEVILAVDVIDVNIVGVIPVDWPRLDESEPISAVLEAGITVNHPRTPDTKFVRSAKIGLETLLGNSAAARRAQTERRLSVLSGPRLRRALRNS